MRSQSRAAFSVFQLLAVLAVIGLVIGLLLPIIQRVREAAARTQSMNNLKQLALAWHNYHDVYKRAPAGVDKNGFSAHARLLPFIEQDNLARQINFDAPVTANAAARQTLIRIFLSPLDPVAQSKQAFAATNYLWNAGSKHDLKDNDGIAYLDSAIRFAQITDGLSNTIMVGETLLGTDTKPADVRRQHVQLGKDALKDLKDDSGSDDWKNGKNLAATRGNFWIEGAFLQSTFTATRSFNDARPDVDCGSTGGLAGLRTLSAGVLVALCDGSTRSQRLNLPLDIWKAQCTRNGGEAIAGDD